MPLVVGTIEAPGIPSRSVLLTGRYAIRSGKHTVVFSGIEGERCHLGVVFDPERDEDRCPQGHSRHRYAVNRTAREAADPGEAPVLNACPVKAKRTTSVHES